MLPNQVWMGIPTQIALNQTSRHCQPAHDMGWRAFEFTAPRPGQGHCSCTDLRRRRPPTGFTGGLLGIVPAGAGGRVLLLQGGRVLLPADVALWSWGPARRMRWTGPGWVPLMGPGPGRVPLAGAVALLQGLPVELSWGLPVELFWGLPEMRVRLWGPGRVPLAGAVALLQGLPVELFWGLPVELFWGLPEMRVRLWGPGCVPLAGAVTLLQGLPVELPWGLPGPASRVRPPVSAPAGSRRAGGGGQCGALWEFDCRSLREIPRQFKYLSQSSDLLIEEPHPPSQLGPWLLKRASSPLHRAARTGASPSNSLTCCWGRQRAREEQQQQGQAQRR